MDKDTNQNSETVQKLSESVTLITLGKKSLHLNEMSIGRGKKFALKLVEAAKELREEIGLKEEDDLAKVEFASILKDYSGPAFQKITDLLNFVFEYREDGFELLTIEWVEENITIRHLKIIVREIAEQNQMGWLLPFFQSKIMGALSQA